MRIGIDATAISGKVVGGFSYMANLITNLLQIDDENDYVIYCRKEIPNMLKVFLNRAEFRICGFRSRKLCEQMWLSTTAPFDSLDILHSCWSLPIYHSNKTVLTAHGLSWLLFPEFFTKSLRLYWKVTAERTYKKADSLIAISESTKKTFIEHLAIKEDKIDVVHHGIDLNSYSNITDKDILNQLKKRYSLPERFILFVSAILPVKNVPTLIKAFYNLKQREGFQDVHLVIAGGKGWKSEPVFDLVNELRIHNSILFTGYFPQQDLATLYSAAELFVLPSFYEGFGIPVLEAFACGTPVITSNTSSLPEVAGDAAILIDPHNPEELADAIEKVLLDESLQQDMIEKGLKRAKEFSWERTAKKTLRVYEKNSS